VARGELLPDRFLAIDGGGVSAPVQGQQTKEPAFGLDAVWIEESRRGEAEGLGYAVTDPASVFITHLTQLLKGLASRILNREDVQTMLESIKRESPTLVKDIEENVKYGVIQKRRAGRRGRYRWPAAGPAASRGGRRMNCLNHREHGGMTDDPPRPAWLSVLLGGESDARA
jgi:hypothetical protein